MVESVPVVGLPERIDRLGAHRAEAIGDQFGMAFALTRGDGERPADRGFAAQALLQAGERMGRISGDDDRGFELRPRYAALLPGWRIRDTPLVEEGSILRGWPVAADDHRDTDLTQVPLEDLEQERLRVDEAGQPHLFDVGRQVGFRGQFGPDRVMVLKSLCFESVQIVFF